MLCIVVSIYYVDDNTIQIVLLLVLNCNDLSRIFIGNDYVTIITVQQQISMYVFINMLGH